MKRKELLFGEEIYLCRKCGEPLESNFETEFSSIKYFGPPIIKCRHCDSENFTMLKPYSEISFIAKFNYWVSVLLAPVIVWFVGAPLFLLVFGLKWIFNLKFDVFIFLLLVPIGFIVGVIFSIRKNLKIIKEIEKTHLELQEKLK